MTVYTHEEFMKMIEERKKPKEEINPKIKKEKIKK